MNMFVKRKSPPGRKRFGRRPITTREPWMEQNQKGTRRRKAYGVPRGEKTGYRRARGRDVGRTSRPAVIVVVQAMHLRHARANAPVPLFAK